MGTRITGDGLTHLRGFSRLRYLILGQTKVTDAGLEHLKGLSQLETLDLHATNCTPEGEKEFQRSVPKCTIAE
jgi:hypothetical protein